MAMAKEGAMEVETAMNDLEDLEQALEEEEEGGGGSWDDGPAPMEVDRMTLKVKGGVEKRRSQKLREKKKIARVTKYQERLEARLGKEESTRSRMKKSL